jgi:hypothetical protein
MQSQSLSNYLWLILLLILHSQLSRLTQAVVLLLVPFSDVLEPFYLESTSVNYHFHQTDTIQHNVICKTLIFEKDQAPVALLLSTTMNIISNLPTPPPILTVKHQKKDIFQPYLL